MMHSGVKSSGGGMNRLWNMFSGVSSGTSESGCGSIHVGIHSCTYVLCACLHMCECTVYSYIHLCTKCIYVQ